MQTKIKKHRIDRYLIPTMTIHLKDRDILNIPTQIGCPVNCAFCPSAESKFVRNLTADEMSHLIEETIDRDKKTLISFTGEGESVLNHRNVNETMSRFDRLEKVEEFRICMSGYRCRNLSKIAKTATKMNLQLSLHSPVDEKRFSLMEKTEPLDDIFSAIEENMHKFETISANYVLVDGFNDSEEDLELLKAIDKRYQIKLNPLLSDAGEIVPNKKTDVFFDELKREGFEVLRFSKVGSSMENKLNDMSYSLA